MPSSYSLTVINNSAQRKPVFAVFAKLPHTSSYQALSLAWLTQQIDSGNRNQYRFTWDITWEFTWASQGTEVGHQWNASGTLPANPYSNNGCAADFIYDGAFDLSPTTHVPNGEMLWVNDGPNVPPPDEKESSVGVALNGSPVCAVAAGPNLYQTFTLHPTYYISAGDYVAGQMVDADSVTGYQELEYADGNTALTATLDKYNIWTVEPTKTINFAQLLATRSSDERA